MTTNPYQKGGGGWEDYGRNGDDDQDADDTDKKDFREYVRGVGVQWSEWS